MPEYLPPGVYIEEVERAPRPIEGVPTSTAAFIGEVERGSIRPRLVTSYAEYRRWFGDVFGPDKFLPYAANGFFENGGRRLYVCRIVGRAAKPAALDVGNGFTLQAAGAGRWGNRVFVKITDSTTRDKDDAAIGFRVRMAYWPAGQTPFDCFADRTLQPQPQLVEDFDDLVTKVASPNFYGKRMPFIDRAEGDANQGPESSAFCTLVRHVGVTPDARPSSNDGAALAGGTDGADDALVLDDRDYKGEPEVLSSDVQGLAALELDPYREVSLVYAPGVDETIAKAIVEYCERTRFRFGVVDAQQGAKTVADLDPRERLDTDGSYAAFYYPWIVTSDPATGARTMIPPGGHTLGVYARTDDERGVFKAPANEVLRGVLDLEADISDRMQDVFNPRGINVVRRFPGRGIRVWGARTITSNALWKYVSVRRLFIFLERSIYEGTQWVVFEPNDERLWARVVDMIRVFLRAQWRLGALFGRKEEEAFFITCDRTTMTQDDILNGRLVCEIGVAPVRPAEFVIFRIFQSTAEAER